MRPASSVTSRKTGGAAGMEEPLCAEVVAAHDNRVAIAPQSAIRNRLEANSFKNFTGRGVSLARKKPHETSWGFRHRSFSRRAWPSAAWEGGLAYGSLADHSGGTAADSHGLPRFPCLQIKFRVYAALAEVSMRD